MRRRAAVQLAEQRRHEKSCQLEHDQEEWREKRRVREQQKQERAAQAAKKHVIEHEAALLKVRERLRKEAEAEAEALQKRWKEQEVETVAKVEQVLAFQQARTEAEQLAQTERVAVEQTRALARGKAVAEYQQARVEAENEACERAAEHVEETRQAAEARILEYNKRRSEAIEKKENAIREQERAVLERWEQHLEHDVIVDQQQAERMTLPYRNHEKERQREAQAPVEVRRLEIARERHTEAERLARDEVVEENRQIAVMAHRQWIHSRRVGRQKVVRRIEVANRERAVRTEEHAASVRRHDEAVAKLEAKKALREATLKGELDDFNLRQSMVTNAVFLSQVGTQVITDSQLETVIESKKSKGKAQGLPRL